MKIVVNCQLLPGVKHEGGADFINQVFNWLVAGHPQHEFVFFTHANKLAGLADAANATQLAVLPATQNLLLLRWWHRYRLPLLLKKHHADVLVNAGGFGSLGTALPQVLLLKELPADKKKIWRKFVPRFIKKAAGVAVVSESAKSQLTATFRTPADKILVTGMGVSAKFAPQHDLDERQLVKDTYSGGREYFLYSGDINPQSNIIHLLKAFSLFKKRQRSNMQLLLAGKISWAGNGFQEKLDTFKFKNDVHLLGNLPEEELAKLMGAGYAFIYPSLSKSFAVPVLQAMHSGLPTIAAPENVRGLAADSALYADANNPEELAAKMMLLYKDENLRTLLIAEGLRSSESYSWQNAANIVWQGIEMAAASANK
jgi:glycosyltransferase involved in cell wall biosynthesis